MMLPIRALSSGKIAPAGPTDGDLVIVVKLRNLHRQHPFAFVLRIVETRLHHNALHFALQPDFTVRG